MSKIAKATDSANKESNQESNEQINPVSPELPPIVSIFETYRDNSLLGGGDEVMKFFLTATDDQKTLAWNNHKSLVWAIFSRGCKEVMTEKQIIAGKSLKNESDKPLFMAKKVTDVNDMLATGFVNDKQKKMLLPDVMTKGGKQSATSLTILTTILTEYSNSIDCDNLVKDDNGLSERDRVKNLSAILTEFGLDLLNEFKDSPIESDIESYTRAMGIIQIARKWYDEKTAKATQSALMAAKAKIKF